MSDYLYDPQHMHTAPDILHRVARAMAYITRPREDLASTIGSADPEWAEAFSDAIAFGWLDCTEDRGILISGRGQAALQALDAAPRQMGGTGS